MERMTGKERLKRWKYITQRKPLDYYHPSANRIDSSKDPFDCSDVVIPVKKKLVEQELKKGIVRWKELDSQIIQDDDEDGRRNKKKRLDWGWNVNRIRLPDYFDVTCRRRCPPPSSSSSSSKRVLGGDDYETKLWHLFHSLRTQEELEQDAIQGNICHHSNQLQQEVIEGFQHNTRLDSHALGRMRLKDRFHLPRITITTTTNNPPVTTHNVIIRMECWRQGPKKGSSSDSNRMEMEFLGSQTLLDVHHAIVTLANDILYSSNNNNKSNGMFFIEDTFYTQGDQDAIDYVTPILQWMDGMDDNNHNTNEIEIPRRDYLGIPHDVPLQVNRSMGSVRLDSLSVRLGVRYMHVFHGDCESSFFFSDVRAQLSNEIVPTYPLIHDVWTHTTNDVCHCCQQLPSSVICIHTNNEQPPPICSFCFQQLYYKSDGTLNDYAKTNQLQVYPYPLLHNYTDLTVGHEPTNSYFIQHR